MLAEGREWDMRLDSEGRESCGRKGGIADWEKGIGSSQKEGHFKLCSAD